MAYYGKGTHNKVNNNLSGAFLYHPMLTEVKPSRVEIERIPRTDNKMKVVFFHSWSFLCSTLPNKVLMLILRGEDIGKKCIASKQNKNKTKERQCAQPHLCIAYSNHEYP